MRKINGCGDNGKHLFWPSVCLFTLSAMVQNPLELLLTNYMLAKCVQTGKSRLFPRLLFSLRSPFSLRQKSISEMSRNDFTGLARSCKSSFGALNGFSFEHKWVRKIDDVISNRAPLCCFSTRSRASKTNLDSDFPQFPLIFVNSALLSSLRVPLIIKTPV